MPVTPQEKAASLVLRHLGWVNSNIRHAKNCALISADEVLLVANDYWFHDEDEIRTKSYWQEVKKEIEKL